MGGIRRDVNCPDVNCNIQHFGKASEVVERAKAGQVDKNLIRSSELVPSGRGVNVFTWHMQETGW